MKASGSDTSDPENSDMIAHLATAAAKTTRLLVLIVGFLIFTLQPNAESKQIRDHNPAWAGAKASENEEVREILNHHRSDRMAVEFAERWAVWIVTFFDGENRILTASVNQDGEVVEIEQKRPLNEADKDERRESEKRRENLLRELELARATGNRVEEREILELLEQLEGETNLELPDVKRRAVDLHPDESTLPAYVLNLPEDGIRRMKRSVTEEINVRGKFRLENEEFPIEIRLRGASTRHAVKKSYRLRFLDQTPFPRKVTHLKAEPMDHTMQQEKLSCDLFKAAGLPVSECRYVNLFINGSYEGVYLDIEPIRSPFKQNKGLDPRGTLVRASTFQHASQRGPIGTLRGDVGSLEKLREFIKQLNAVGRDEFESFARTHTDWPRIRDYMAMQVICHRSEIEADDYLFYRAPDTNKWSLIPRDHNNGNFSVLANRNRIAPPSISIFPQTIQDIGWQPDHWFVLPSRIFNNPTLRNDYLDRLEQYTHQLLLSDFASERIEANFQELLSAYPQDPYRKNWPRHHDPFLRSEEELKSFAARHGKRLLDLIKSERERRESDLKIGAISTQDGFHLATLYNHGTEHLALDQYSLATKDSNGHNRTVRLWGQIAPGDRQIVQLDQETFNFTGGLLALTKFKNGLEDEEWKHNRIVDFTYQDQKSSANAQGP